MAILGFAFLTLLANIRQSVALLTPVVSMDFGVELQILLELIQKEQPYEWIFLFREHAMDCIDENLPSLFKVPTLIRDTEQPVYLKGHFSSELLTIVCLRTTQNLESLNVLAQDMQHMRYKRVLVINKEVYREPFSSQKLVVFFQRCKELKLLKVNVIHRDFARTGIYHSYIQFPGFGLEKQYLLSSERSAFYPDRLKDMKGKIVLTLPDQYEPASLLYRDKAGKQQMAGYLGKLMRTFAAHHNCTLHFPHEVTEGHRIYVSTMRSFTRNESIDIGTGLSTAQREQNTHEYTYPVEIGKWLVMVPIEQETPIYLRLLSLFNVEFLLPIIVLCWLLSMLFALKFHRKEHRSCQGISLLQLFCNEIVVRGMLGQPFRLQKLPKLRLKCLYVLIFLAGFFVTVLLNTHLIRVLTAPPIIKPITTFDELMAKNVKILTYKSEIPHVVYFSGEEFWEKYQSIFTILPSQEDYIKQRRSFNSNCAFSITTSDWSIFAEQQKYFVRKLYSLEPELSFTDLLLFGLPVNENSIYKDPFNSLLMDLFASGIFNHWFSTTFYDMVKMGRISFKDFSTARQSNALKIDDFYWTWVLYLGGVSFSCLVFLVELLCFDKFRRRRINAARVNERRRPSRKYGTVIGKKPQSVNL